MTSQTKFFIELTDIASLRFDCKGCGSVALLPFDKFRDVPAMCPNCQQEFVQFTNTTVQTVLRDFVRSVQQVKKLTESGASAFTFAMEIVPPVAKE